jgi:hypothetical protein
MNLIEAWLKGGQPYAIGVRLYMLHGRDKSLHRLFNSEGETPFKKQKLAAALRELVSGAPATSKGSKPAPVYAHTQEVFAKSWPESKNTTDTHSQLWQQARLLLKEIAELHGKLDVVGDVDERRQIAFQLLRKDDDLDEIYAQRDFLTEHGHLPKPQPSFQTITDPYLMAQRIANLKRYLRRERKAVATDPENEVAAARLKEYTEEYNHYAIKLGRPTC